MTLRQGPGPRPPLTAGQRLRQAANVVNGSTLAGVVVALAARTRLSAGPRGLILAEGYAWRLPVAGAFTLGNVVLCRGSTAGMLARPALLGHEERHCTQYAWCLGLPFIPLYLLAAGWSVARTGNPGTGNVFERNAGLAAGGYPVHTPPRKAVAGAVRRLFGFFPPPPPRVQRRTV
ncbi:hypothetical protein ACRB8A_07055 [Arthrobacter sp. G.S.26]|uniref:hypothetical protein n=1 Tax=Micrococcaceae TaxID=1268 RepID=UPI002555B66F|nr:hypothetical protein [Pseudarthrobacter sp. MEB009]